MNYKLIIGLAIIIVIGLIFGLIYYKRGKLTMFFKDAREKTFAIIKPDAVAAKNSGKIIDIIEANGFDIVAIKKLTISKYQAEAFYEVHKDKSFYKELIDYITSGPVIIMVLSKENSVIGWRNLMGTTDPLKAEQGTIRKMFGTSIGSNAVHGSDSLENAKREIGLFFPDICNCK